MVKTEQTAAIALPEQDSPILSIIADVSKDPNVSVDVMQKLVDLQLRVMDEERQIALNAALAKLEPLLKTLAKSKAGAPTKTGNVKFFYTPYEDIDRMMRPHLRTCGLSLSFSTRAVSDKIYFVAQVQEVTKGGIREAVIPYAPDTSSQMNNPQNVASGLSYAKRVAVTMLFNLVFEGEDDDAQATSTITAEQASQIEDLIHRSGADKSRFLKYLGVSSVEQIQQRDLVKATVQLNQKLSAKTNG